MWVDATLCTLLSDYYINTPQPIISKKNQTGVSLRNL